MNHSEIPLPSTSFPGAPLEDQEPVFNAPWEATAFAIVNHLAADERCTWPEWTQYLVEQISVTEQGGSSSATYYEQWVMACEKLLADKGLVDAQEIRSKIEELIAERETEHQH